MIDRHIKKILFLNCRAAHGTSYAKDVLDAALVGGTLEQSISLAFMNDGVFQLKKSQQPVMLQLPPFFMTYGALSIYDIHAIYVERESLLLRGLSEEDLLHPVTVLDSAAFGRCLEHHAFVFNL